MNFKSLNYNNFVIDDVLDVVIEHHKKKKKKAKKKQRKHIVKHEKLKEECLITSSKTDVEVKNTEDKSNKKQPLVI